MIDNRIDASLRWVVWWSTGKHGTCDQKVVGSIPSRVVTWMGNCTRTGEPSR